MQEYACSVADVLALRTRLAFLSCDAAEEALPAVLRIMAKELCWDEDRIEQEKQIALEVIRQDMGSVRDLNFFMTLKHFSFKFIKIV